jgi:hypothetical protein
MPLLDRLAAVAKHVPSGGLTAASVVTHDWGYLGLAAVIEVLRNPIGTALNGVADNFKRVRKAKTDGKVERVRIQNAYDAKRLRAKLERRGPISEA